MRSSDSTANFLETALILDKTASESLAAILNCAKAAIRPSAVFLISPNEGAKLDRATARIEART